MQLDQPKNRLSNALEPITSMQWLRTSDAFILWIHIMVSMVTAKGKENIKIHTSFKCLKLRNNTPQSAHSFWLEIATFPHLTTQALRRESSHVPKKERRTCMWVTSHLCPMQSERVLKKRWKYNVWTHTLPQPQGISLPCPSECPRKTWALTYSTQSLKNTKCWLESDENVFF